MQNLTTLRSKKKKRQFLKKVTRQNTNIEKYPQKNQMRSPGLKDGESKKELEPDNSSCVTCFVQNPSMLQTYVTNTCKLGHNFGNSFTGFVFLTMLFSFYNS